MLCLTRGTGKLRYLLFLESESPPLSQHHSNLDLRLPQKRQQVIKAVVIDSSRAHPHRTPRLSEEQGDQAAETAERNQTFTNP